MQIKAKFTLYNIKVAKKAIFKKLTKYFLNKKCDLYQKSLRVIKNNSENTFFCTLAYPKIQVLQNSIHKSKVFCIQRTYTTHIITLKS